MRRIAAAVAAAAAASLLLALLRRRSRWWLEQRLLRLRLVDDRDLIDARSVRLVAGVDISFVKDSETDACAALAVLELPSLRCVHFEAQRVSLRAPYIPGYLAFREVGHLLALLGRLRRSAPHLVPAAVLVDGNGVLHPNGFGLASHLGVISGIPTVGVGKSIHNVDGLCRESVRAVAAECCRTKGECAPLVGRSGAVWGSVVRTTEPAESGGGGGGFKPVIVSVGHGLRLESCVDLVRACTLHRVPEPIRQADLRSREWLREHGLNAS